MHAPIYRNLDKPFHILGFSPYELILLIVIFVGGGEVLELISLNRGWSALLTILLAVNLIWLRRSLGDLFIRRLIRFVKLPSEFHRRLIKQGSI